MKKQNNQLIKITGYKKINHLRTIMALKWFGKIS